MIRIKRDKLRNQIEILDGNNPLFQRNTEDFIRLSEAIIEFITKEHWKISTEKELGRQGGIYYYHLSKNYFLSAKHELKKWLRDSLKNKKISLMNIWKQVTFPEE